MKTCERCQQPFDELIGPDGVAVDPGAIGAGLLRARITCWPCADMVLDDAKQREATNSADRREREFLETIPPLYRDTYLDDPRLNPAFRDAAKLWDVSGGIGLGLIGESGTGKTRLLFHCLRNAHAAGRSVRWISHNRFSKLVIGAFVDRGDGWTSDCHAQLAKLFDVDVLLIDDLGKAPSTERCDAELEELIEVRGTHFRPTLWSCNGSSEWLASRFGADRGKPMVRRLATFTKVVKA